MHPDDWKSRGVYRKINGRNLFLVDEGDPGQETILLIHGFRTSSWDWQAVWSSLRKSYRLVAPEAVSGSYLKFLESVNLGS